MEFVPKLFNREGTLKYSLNTPLHTAILCQALELWGKQGKCRRIGQKTTQLNLQSWVGSPPKGRVYHKPSSISTLHNWIQLSKVQHFTLFWANIIIQVVVMLYSLLQSARQQQKPWEVKAGRWQQLLTNPNLKLWHSALWRAQRTRNRSQCQLGTLTLLQRVERQCLFRVSFYY